MNEKPSQEELFTNALKDYEAKSDVITKKMVSGNLKFLNPVTPWSVLKTVLMGLVGRYSMNNGVEGIFTIEEDGLIFYYRRIQGLKGGQVIEYHEIIPYNSIKSVKLSREVGFRTLKIKGIHQDDKYRIRIFVNGSEKQFPNHKQYFEKLCNTLNQKGFEI